VIKQVYIHFHWISLSKKADMNTKLLLRMIDPYKKLIFSLISVVVVLYLTVNFLMPKLNDIFEIQKQNKSESELVKTLGDKLSILKGINKEDTKLQLEKISLILPDEKNIPYLFTTLDFLAEKTGINFESIDFKSGSILKAEAPISRKVPVRGRAETYRMIEITANFKGTEEQTNDFLTNMYALKSRVFLPKRVNIKIKEDNIRSVNVLFETYYSPLINTLGDVGSALPKFSPSLNNILSQAVQEEIYEGEQGVAVSTAPKSNLFTY